MLTRLARTGRRRAAARAVAWRRAVGGQIRCFRTEKSQSGGGQGDGQIRWLGTDMSVWWRAGRRSDKMVRDGYVTVWQRAGGGQMDGSGRICHSLVEGGETVR